MTVLTSLIASIALAGLHRRSIGITGGMRQESGVGAYAFGDGDAFADPVPHLTADERDFLHRKSDIEFELIDGGIHRLLGGGRGSYGGLEDALRHLGAQFR